MSTDQIFIKNSAPALCGIKPANLFSLNTSNLTSSKIIQWKKHFNSSNLELFDIHYEEDLYLFFACDISWVYKIISDSENVIFLKSLDYTINSNPYIILNQLFSRLIHSAKFPHEIGLFLGYPLNDVKSFISNQGKNSQNCGYWKSYSNTDEAEKIFNKYRHCCNSCMQWFDEGLSVPQIISKYKKTVITVA